MTQKIILPLSLALITNAQSATILREVDAGDFSDNFTMPTEFNLMPGVNTLQLTIGGGSTTGGAPNGTGGATNGSDADFVLFRVPAGSQVTSILVTESEGGSHFFGAQFGDSFSQQPENSVSFQNSLAAFMTFSASPLTSQFIGPGNFGGQRFATGPTSNFTGLFQETGTERSQVTLEVTLVPEPSSALLCFLGLAPLLRRRR